MVATDLPMLFLFFEPGGRPRRFAFLAMETSMIGDGGLYSRYSGIVMAFHGCGHAKTACRISSCNLRRRGKSWRRIRRRYRALWERPLRRRSKRPALKLA